MLHVNIIKINKILYYCEEINSACKLRHNYLDLSETSSIHGGSRSRESVECSRCPIQSGVGGPPYAVAGPGDRP